MRYTHILLVFCAILNIYQCRYTILQLTDTCLKTVIWFLTDFHHHIQQLKDSSKVILTSDTADIHYNYNLSEYERECPKHHYSIQIISRRPLIIYIEHFLTSNEMQHLIELANPRGGTPVVKCLEKRFAQFQGNTNPVHIEPFQIVKYQSSQFFNPHFDWFSDGNQLDNGGQRVTTFFTYLYANCTEGETEFLEIKYNHTLHSRFCNILVCDDMAEQRGLRFRPISGNSIFWFNVDEDGNEDDLTLHAGRPPSENGIKLGLNTWTRQTIFHYEIDKTD